MADKQQRTQAAPEKDAPLKPRRRQRQIEKGYWIVNPAGCLHLVSREHASQRLRQAGYRLATKEEIAELQACGGLQEHDNPIVPRWAPTPDADPILPD